MLEKQIEAKVCAYAKEKGCLVYKFTSPGRASVPDRMFVYQGEVFFIEFKRKGKKPTVAQEREIGRLRDNGVRVWTVDDVDGGKWVIDWAITGSPIPDGLLYSEQDMIC